MCNVILRRIIQYPEDITNAAEFNQEDAVSRLAENQNQHEKRRKVETDEETFWT
jgi:hypothetical protein